MESKSSQKPMKSLIVLFIMHLIIRTMRVKKYMLLSLHGHLIIKQILVLLSSRPIRIGKMNKFTFDVVKCDRIFDGLLKLGKIKIPHTLPPLDEIKKRAYCKFHHSSSHATN
jgi:hypothetical protein